MTGPKTLKEHIGPALRTAAAEAGRAEGSVNVAAALPVSVTEDVDGARSVAAQQFAMYGYERPRAHPKLAARVGICQ